MKFLYPHRLSREGRHPSTNHEPCSKARNHPYSWQRSIRQQSSNVSNEVASNTTLLLDASESSESTQSGTVQRPTCIINFFREKCRSNVVVFVPKKRKVKGTARVQKLAKKRLVFSPCQLVPYRHLHPKVL